MHTDKKNELIEANSKLSYKKFKDSYCPEKENCLGAWVLHMRDKDIISGGLSSILMRWLISLNYREIHETHIYLYNIENAENDRMSTVFTDPSEACY